MPDVTLRPHVVYDVDDRPPLKEAVPLAAQHLLAMFLGNITPPLLIAGGLGFVTGETAFMLQMALFAAGVATIVQAYPIGPVGGRIPIVMGTSIAFVGSAVGVGKEYGLAAVFGACLAAAMVEVVLGFGIVRVRRFFPPLVCGVVVMLIGLTLIPVGMDYAAGGVGAADYGSLANLGVAALVLVVTLALNFFARGFLSYSSVLAGLLLGYAATAAAGRVDFSAVAEAGWFSLPVPLAYGIDFKLAPILIFSVLYVISTMESVGDISGVIAAVDRDPTDQELRGGLVADGVMSAFAALFSAFPNTTYSQNVGLVNFTGVVSRHVTAITGVFLVVLGLIPKVGAVVATIPPPVIGGAGIVMFAMIFSSGFAIVHRAVALGHRNMVILAVSVGVGLGCELRPDALQYLPAVLQDFLRYGLISGGLTALFLNWIVPERRAS
jgi:NCS2 family nucleobase:cation symporter-2